MSHDVTIIILTYKSKNLTIDYIKNLYKKFKIIIVDNSKDTELERLIKNSYPDVDIHLISNNGYSTQINYGVNFVKTKYFLISNPDVRGINEIDIMRFLDVAERLNNKFSALGPRYIDANPKSIKQSKNNEDIAELRF